MSLHFRGSIDDVRLFSRGLSINEILSFYAFEVVPCQPIVLVANGITVDCAQLRSSHQLQVSMNLTNWSNWGESLYRDSQDLHEQYL